ncbi:MAG: type II toxin-antitoxin system RelE/ParE family toxin [Propionibacteriaceae bacterium]|jgi:plasmid stabilization system protein ParE|nr:type II toxin-antitoxin system RelE/ParE family toxin [Propionibacteriaceae bacterium]
MKYTVIFAQTASEQLEAIQRYIASTASPSIAEQYVDAIVDHCLDLDTFPHRGVQRNDLRPGVRLISYRKRVDIAFVVSDDTLQVTIISVFYGGQDLEAAFAFAPEGDPLN